MADILGAIANPQMADIAGAIDYREQKLARDEAKRKEIRTNEIMGKALSSGLNEGSTMHQLALENPQGYLSIAKHMGIDPSDGNGMHQMTVDVHMINNLAKTDPQQAIDYMMSEKDRRSKLGLNTDYLDKGLAAAQANPQQFLKAVEISDQTWNPPSAKEGFTLGDTRYDSTGKIIATNPKASEMTPFEKAQVAHWTDPTNGGANGLSEDAKNILAERLLQGEKSSAVLGNIGRGAQGAADLRDIQNKVAEKAKTGGLDANRILQNTQSVSADNRTFLELGAREGKIAPRVQEANSFAKIALEASKNVDRGDFVPWSKLSQYSGKQLSDPKLAKLHAATQSLVNAYASAIGGGVMTEGNRQEANRMLYDAQGKDAYEAVVNQMLIETQAALDSPKLVREHMHSQKTDPAQQSTPAAGATSIGRFQVEVH